MNWLVRASLLNMLLSLGACTFVYIEGDHNAVSDTGGHGGGVQLPTRTEVSHPESPLQQIIPPQH
ncbi:hypothetical protein [Caballeronia pedi]|nr:hypothetical protein [Caballeronia pedi]